jgi:hypothetical protein
MQSPLARMSDEDFLVALRYLGRPRVPDLIIAPDGNPYLYRWHLVRSKEACVYFHMQVADDPERPLHDHPWDNMSVILAGGYREVIQPEPPRGKTYSLVRRPGDTIFRRAEEAHRLFLPEGTPYTLTQFCTGPKLREWGFWYDNKWVPYTDVTKVLPDGRSVHTANTPWLKESKHG